MPPDHPICKGQLTQKSARWQNNTRERPTYPSTPAKKKLECFINKFPTVAPRVFHHDKRNDCASTGARSPGGGMYE